MVLQNPNVIQFPKSEGSSNKEKARKIKFTQTRVEALRHQGEGTHYVYDSEKPGLAVRLTSGGARTFVFVGRLHGKVERINLGRIEALPLARARSAIDKIRGDVALGVDVVAQRKALREADAERTTLNCAFDEFMASGRHRPKTALDYRNLWTLYVQKGVGKRSIKDTTTEDIRKIHAKVAAAVSTRMKHRAQERPDRIRPRSAGSGVAAQAGASRDWKGHRTANKVVALLRAVLAFTGRRSDNPAREVVWFRQFPRRRRLSDEEAQRFRKALDGFEPAWRDFFTLLLLTGARRQSLLAMRWKDVEIERKRWVIPAIWSKHGDEMVIPLTREAAILLSEMKERRGASEWVFPSQKSRSGHIEEPKAAWVRLLKLTGIRELRLHDLRRTFGSRLAEFGASGAVIAAAMGHKSLQSARSYLHLQVNAVREAAERASIRLDGDA